MSFTKHDAIVVTYWNEIQIKAVLAKAVELGLPVSGLVQHPYNGGYSFLIAPDGSLEGWAPSDEGDKAREAWCTWVRENHQYVRWVHVSYDEEHNVEIVAHDDRPRDE